jgi:hypothetical protein
MADVPSQTDPAWHTRETGEIAEALGVDPRLGLDEAEAARRLAAAKGG